MRSSWVLGLLLVSVQARPPISSFLEAPLRLLRTVKKDSNTITTLNNEEEIEVWENDLEHEVEEAEEAERKGGEIPEKTVRDAVSGFFSNAKQKLSCQVCKRGFRASVKLARLRVTQKPAIKAFIRLCKDVSGQPASVCNGIFHSLGPTLFEVFSRVDLNNPYVLDMGCYALGEVCPMPDIPLEQLPLPAKVKFTPPKPARKYKYVMQISDLHYDNEYTEGAEVQCNKPLCCQADSNSDMANKTIIQPAKKWGEYTCDINGRLLDSLMRHAASVNARNQFDMVLFTGDLPAHDMWKEDVIETSKEESDALRFIDRHFDPSKNKLYPVVGNHEAVPVNLFPMENGLNYKDYYLYNFLADEWKRWIPKEPLEQLSKRGYYSMSHSPKLKILSLNNNLYYSLNFYNLLIPMNADPNGMFKWMIDELYDAEVKGQMVYLVGHIPPGSNDFYPHWAKSYYRIIQRFSHIISGQFYGHEHWDEFELFYSSPNKTGETAINTAYLTPSISTFGGTNPGYRVFKVDADTYQVVDYIQYYADLSEQDKWKNDAEWKVLYSARRTYGLNQPGVPLSPKFWHTVTEDFEKDPAYFDTFYNLRNKRGIALPECNEKCRSDFICVLRAGQSSDNCIAANPFG